MLSVAELLLLIPICTINAVDASSICARAWKDSTTRCILSIVSQTLKSHHLLLVDSHLTTQIFADTAFAVSLGQFSRLSDTPWHSRQKYWRSIANTEATRRKSSRPALVFLVLFRQTSGKLYPDLTQSRHLTCEPGWNIIHKSTHSPECSDSARWGSCSL